MPPDEALDKAHSADTPLLLTAALEGPRSVVAFVGAGLAAVGQGPPSRDQPAPKPVLGMLSNQLTMARLVLALVIFALLIAHGTTNNPTRQAWQLNLAFVVFLVAGVTDLLDGWVARRYNTITAFGRVMDPFADKVLICGALILLSGPDFSTAAGHHPAGLTPWMAVVVLARELMASSVRGFSESRRTAFPAAGAGKFKMLCQSVLVGWLLFALANCRQFSPTDQAMSAPLQDWAWWLSQTLLALAGAATIYSGWLYLDRACRLVLCEDAPTPDGRPQAVMQPPSAGEARPLNIPEGHR